MQVRQLPLGWGKYEEKGLRRDGTRLRKTSGRYSTTLAQSAVTHGRAFYKIRKTNGNGPCASIGVLYEPETDLSLSFWGSTLNDKVWYIWDSGTILTGRKLILDGCGEWKATGRVVAILINQIDHSVTFYHGDRVCGKVDNLPNKALWFALQIDDINDEFEMIESWSDDGTLFGQSTPVLQIVGVSFRNSLPTNLFAPRLFSAYPNPGKMVYDITR